MMKEPTWTVKAAYGRVAVYLGSPTLPIELSRDFGKFALDLIWMSDVGGFDLALRYGKIRGRWK